MMMVVVLLAGNLYSDEGAGDDGESRRATEEWLWR